MQTLNGNTDSSVYFVLTHGCPRCPRTERNSVSVIKLNFLLEEESDTVGVCFNAGNRLRERLLYVPLCLVGNIGKQRMLPVFENWHDYMCMCASVQVQ